MNKKTESKQLVKGKLQKLNEYLKIINVYASTEFETKKVLDFSNNTEKIMRFLSRKEVKNVEKLQQFQELYEKELKYYGKLSVIQEVEEGFFYLRDKIAGVTLKKYAQAIGFSLKKREKDLTTHELKLILSIWKELNDLPILHCNLSENNIIIDVQRKWNLSRTFTIQFIDFTSHTCPKIDIKKSVHDIFKKRIGIDAYAELCEKYKL